MWSQEPVPDSWEYLCIHKILRPATPPNQLPPQPIPAILPLLFNQELPVTPPPQPDQLVMSPDYELIYLAIPEDIPDLLDAAEDVMSDFNAWTQDVLHYQY